MVTPLCRKDTNGLWEKRKLSVNSVASTHEIKRYLNVKQAAAYMSMAVWAIRNSAYTPEDATCPDCRREKRSETLALQASKR